MLRSIGKQSGKSVHRGRDNDPLGTDISSFDIPPRHFPDTPVRRNMTSASTALDHGVLDN